MTPLLQLEDITRSFVLPSRQRLTILRGLDLTVEASEVTAIVGRSGSGKSTLLNILGLLDAPTSGRVLCNGSDMAQVGDGGRCRLRGEMLGFIFQHFHLLERRSALENVSEPLFYAGRTALAARNELAHAALDQVG
ncbi:MAG TPA: ATP-binding cassette domain-containing protein, partial [Thermomicrobiales bacterium]|nr:ATP-binding cassette domain-containing protein [Thermomicrobiales bacterium]